MATTGSSGLNNALSNTAVTQTTLPSWYDTAQQNIINQAGTAQQAAPQFQNTAAQGAVNTLQGAANPFTQAQGTLNTIAQGAANPWITDPTTGAVTPNTSTAMGGLFAAQDQQLNTMLPSLTSGAEGAAIGSGNFGSLRGQTAVDTAKTQALANLQAQQMQSALQNQQTGVGAATGLGSVGAQGITSGLTTGAAQMNAPFQGVTNYANLVNAVNAPTTASQQTQLSPLNMLGSIGSAGTGLLNSLLPTGVSGTSGYNPGVLNQLQSLFPSLFGSNSSGSSNSIYNPNIVSTGGSGTVTTNDGLSNINTGGTGGTSTVVDNTTGQVLNTTSNQTLQDQQVAQDLQQ
jgi:hypothetical protein